MSSQVKTETKRQKRARASTEPTLTRAQRIAKLTRVMKLLRHCHGEVTYVVASFDQEREPGVLDLGTLIGNDLERLRQTIQRATNATQRDLIIARSELELRQRAGRGVRP